MNYKLITCIFSNNKGKAIIEYLSKEKTIITADRSNSRGTSLSNARGIEMEVITVLVEQSQADEIFEYLFFEAELDKPHNGIIYQQNIRKASKYSLPKED